MASPATAFNFQGKSRDELGTELLILLVNDDRYDEQQALALVAAGANTEVVNDREETPLLLASFKGKTKVALALIGANANVDTPDFLKITPVMAAAGGGYDEIFDALVAKNASLAGKNELEETLFFQAAEGGSEHIVRQLIALEAPLEEPNFVKTSPRFAADNKGHVKIMALIDDAIFARDLPLRQEAERKAYALAHIGDSFRDGIGVDTAAPEKASFRPRARRL